MKIIVTLLFIIATSAALANTSVMSLGEFQHAVATVSGSANPVYYDIDRDGKRDIITGCKEGKIYIYKNTGTSAAPIFDICTPVLLDDGTVLDAGSTSSPDLIDWNGDDLPDLIVGVYKGVYLYTNCTATAGVIPSFAAAGPLPVLGTVTNIIYEGGECSIKFLSYDGTSSNDLLVGVNDGTKPIKYYKNIGTYNSPILTNMGNLKDPAGVDLGFGYGPSPLYFDMEHDGTNELIVSDMGYIYVYYTTNYPPAWIKKKEYRLSPKVIYAKLNLCGDINNDGLFDLILGDFTGGLFWLTNRGTVANADFLTYESIPATRTNVVFGHSSCVVNIWDYNGDGLWDITLRRTDSSGMRLYSNIGTSNSPVFNWFELEDYAYNYPDKFYSYDGNQFRYSLRGDGIRIYTNSGSYSSPVFSNYQDLMEGTNIIPYVYRHSDYDAADLNGDGKLDLWYIFYGTNYWFENTNDNFTPIYKQREIAVDNLGSNMIFTTTYKYVPEIYDWNGDGKLDLIVAEMGGNIHYYRNISNFPPEFVDEGLFEVTGEGEVDFGYYPYGFGIEDIDNNGFANLFIGFSDGTTREFEATPEPGLFIIYSLIFGIYYLRKFYTK